MEEEKSLLSLPIYSENVKEAMVIEVTENLNKILNSAVVDECGVSSRKNIQPSIHKIPEFMSRIHEKAFEPQLVSFGPYHHGKPHLAPMEQEKKEAFCRFKTDYRVKVESMVERVANILENLFEAYDKLEEKWKKNPRMFVEVMIVDACFMLIFFKQHPRSLSTLNWDIRRDMMLLENQLPMKLLQELYILIDTNQDEDHQSFKILRSLICKSMLIDEHKEEIRNDLHILDMYRASLLFPAINKKSMTNPDSSEGEQEKMYDPFDPKCQIIPQAILLHEAGIKFKKSITNSVTDVSFDTKQGVLKLPYLAVDDGTEVTLLNVMAFEKLNLEAGREVTSFVVLMNNLIDVDKDVTLLSSKEILANAVGNDESAADLFGLLGKGAAMDLDSHITDVHWKVNKHCSQTWNKWYASLKHKYFQSPWATISLSAAISGFVIITVQLIYQIIDYYRGN